MVSAHQTDRYLAIRVASRFVRAKGFTSPEQLQEYLKSHPAADPQKHWVEKADKPKKGPPPLPKKKPAQPPPVPEKARQPKPPPVPEKARQPKPQPESQKPSEAPVKEPPKALKERLTGMLKGLGAKARSFVQKAPEAVQSFVADPEYRKKAVESSVSLLKELPEAAVERIKETVKAESHEFKEASEGVKAALTGKKVSKKQKDAMKIVGFHLALMTAVTALHAAGPLSMAGGMATALAKHIAAKATARSIDKAHVLGELGHLGQGIADILSKVAADKKRDPDYEKLYTQYVVACVAKEIESLDDEDMKAALEAMEA